MDDRSAPHVIERALDAPRIPVEAFLTSRAGGLGLDVACDAATREAMQRALTELAITPVQALRGRRCDAGTSTACSRTIRSRIWEEDHRTRRTS